MKTKPQQPKNVQDPKKVSLGDAAIRPEAVEKKPEPKRE